MYLFVFNMKYIHGEEVDFSKYRTKVVLIRNVATKCGFAKQYKELEELNQKYKEEGLCILGFPSDQFKQEFKDVMTSKLFVQLNTMLHLKYLLH